MGSIFRAMKIFSIAALACVAQGLNMQLDEGVPCDNFGGKFDKIKNMKPKCTANKGPVQKKYRCNLQCTNGNTNVWSVRPIKCKVKNANSDKNPKYDSSKPTEYKWKPNQIKGADTLCDDKEECDNVRSIYNLTNKLLDWTKTQVNERQIRFDFACNDYTNKDSGKVFKMVPYPADTATCTCNYNKPSNVRCKWSKIKKSIVRCVRADRPKGQNDDYYYPDMYEYDLYDY